MQNTQDILNFNLKIAKKISNLIIDIKKFNVDFDAEWNDDLVGFVISFGKGKSANTQYEIEENRLHGDFGEASLNRYTDYDSELNAEQHAAVDYFVEKYNILKNKYD